VRRRTGPERQSPWAPGKLSHRTPQTGVEVLGELGRRGVSSRRQRPDHEEGIRRELLQPRRDEMPEPARHPVPDDRVPDRPAHDEAGARPIVTSSVTEMDDEP
jgi:hypothetical protein